MIDEKLIVDLRQYILAKTGVLYFNRIKSTTKDLMVSCPFHKEGQERKPSCGIKKHTDDKGQIGTVHCFSCGVTTNISLMLQQLLGPQYNEDEIESMFGIKTLIVQDTFIEKPKTTLFKLPIKNTNVENSEKILRQYRYYHPYLQQRKITKEVAQIYDIGYDEYNKHITFPIRDINKTVIGIGRRSINYKKYFYPSGMTKPLYGVYELPRFVRYLWIVEGPFNLWSLKGWNKTRSSLIRNRNRLSIRTVIKNTL